MFRHDTIHAEACRLARYAAKCRAAGDEPSAKRYQAKALALVGQLPSRSVTEWRPRARRCLAAALGLLALCALPSIAEAKPRKPSVCVEFELTETKAGKVIAVCYDGTSPKVLETWTVVKLSSDGQAVGSYLVGF